jgi:hypothetical protein
MALEQHGAAGSRIRRTGAFKSLDPTEKGSVSYFLGMTLCKLFADKLLGTPWLLHLDVFRDQLEPRILTGRSRPDFVGQETFGGAWHVFESKGRVRPPGANEKAKAQAQRLVSVDGRTCRLHVDATTYFRGNALRFYWRDRRPEEPKKLRSIALEVSQAAWRYYYEPVTDLIRTVEARLGSTGDGRPIAQIEEADILVGAHPKILPLLLDRKWQDARLVSIQEARVFQTLGYRPDGLIIKSGQSWRWRFQERAG